MDINRKYVIINSNEVSSVDFDLVDETSADTLRYSLDGNKTFVKFSGAIPIFLIGKATYSLLEIKSILAGEEWTVLPEIIETE